MSICRRSTSERRHFTYRINFIRFVFYAMRVFISYSSFIHREKWTIYYYFYYTKTLQLNWYFYSQWINIIFFTITTNICWVQRWSWKYKRWRTGNWKVTCRSFKTGPFWNHFPKVTNILKNGDHLLNKI